MLAGYGRSGMESSRIRTSAFLCGARYVYAPPFEFVVHDSWSFIWLLGLTRSHNASKKTDKSQGGALS